MFLSVHAAQVFDIVSFHSHHDLVGISIILSTIGTSYGIGILWKNTLFSIFAPAEWIDTAKNNNYHIIELTRVTPLLSYFPVLISRYQSKVKA
jgi:hypothetical protein